MLSNNSRSFIAVLSFFYSVFISDIKAQDLSKCHSPELCSKYIQAQYTCDDRLVLKNNWNDFAANDLEENFSLSDTNIVTFSLKLDALGCVYPGFVNNKEFKEAFLHKGLKQKRFYKLSFLDVFDENKKFRDRIASENIILFQILEKENKFRYSKELDTIADATFAFKKEWNKYFLPPLTNKLQAIIQKYHIKNVFFFIHGFNVPYSLAQLQGNEVAKRIGASMDVKNGSQKLLIVRVFWPSLSLKKDDFLCDQSKCNVQNKKLAIFSTKLYNYVTNRAYLCGNTLNNVIAQLSDSIKYGFISHSFGSVISAATVFNPLTKISYADTCSAYNRNIIKLFRESQSSLAKYKMIYLMNAPAMPGKSTFQNFNHQENKNHFFYIGYNPQDEMLLKRQFLWFKFPAGFNSTTLGCNYENEIDSVKKIAIQANLIDNIYPLQTSHLTEHDVFCYLQQPGFGRLFKQFIAPFNQ